MVSLEDVRATNAKLRERLGAGTVAVFVGGTSGIGEHTLRAFAKHTDAAKIYVVGRNETAANKIIKDLQPQNPSHTLTFVRSDVSMLSNVDTACQQIATAEKSINYLFLSPGILAWKGRDDTPEHVPRKLALHYYARFRFISNLLPLLEGSSSQSGLQSTSPPRVLTVLAAGYEWTPNLRDLALQQPSSYSMYSCAANATTMTSLSVAHLAANNPGISFIHSHPGAVRTNIGSDGGWLMRTLKGAGFMLTSIFVKVSDAEESGERHLWALTAEEFAPRSKSGAGDATGATNSFDAAYGKDTGAYLLGKDGEKSGSKGVLDALLKDGWARKVWEHTLKFSDEVVARKSVEEDR